MLKSQLKCKLHLAKYGNCNIQFEHNNNVISVSGLYNMLTTVILDVPSLQEGTHKWKPVPFFEILLSVVSVLLLCVGLRRVLTPLMLIQVTREDINFVNELREQHLHHWLFHSTVISSDNVLD